jgi:hypothetical protein
VTLTVLYQEIVQLDEGGVQPVHGDLLLLAAVLHLADTWWLEDATSGLLVGIHLLKHKEKGRDWGKVWTGCIINAAYDSPPSSGG